MLSHLSFRRLDLPTNNQASPQRRREIAGSHTVAACVRTYDEEVQHPPLSSIIACTSRIVLTVHRQRPATLIQLMSVPTATRKCVELGV